MRGNGETARLGYLHKGKNATEFIHVICYSLKIFHRYISVCIDYMFLGKLV